MPLRLRGLDPELFTALRTDPNRLWQLLQEHIVDGKYTTANVIDDQVLRTRAGTELRLRLRKDAKTFTVNTARVIDTDNEGLSGIIHVVDSILYKPSLTIGTFLRNHGNFSSFIQGLSSAGVMSRLSSEPGPFTVFALPDPDPSDDNVEYLTLWRILQSPEYIGHIINNHVVEGFIPLKGLEEHYYYEISNLNKEPLILLKDGNITSAGIADVIEPDILATNGVVHIVNRIIQRVY
ncbi:unnamed protein product [Cyprideis torosa]|uniref:Uncharacterized protein n=1 Tax=Cyprideis torosa TaxID=163714 RepID=A0A7R8WKS1_9CRUS|nr:unnamed protein product [Cyprideis torosa]CAG0897282.1 unnamed protein product [Cyprideis torosa]